MQIFLPYKSAFDSADALDPLLLNKQIIECKQILSAILGKTKAWRNHPVTRMYENNQIFLVQYMQCLSAFRSGDLELAKYYSNMAERFKPEFLKDADWYFDNFKKRLYTKDPDKYSRFYSYGESHSNYYYVGDKWVEYKQ